MPGPVIFPCGGEGQPACPPQPAVDMLLVPAVEIVRAYSRLSIEERGQAYAELAQEPKGDDGPVA